MAAPLAAILPRIGEAAGALGAAADAAGALGAWGGALLVAAGVAVLTVATRFPRPLASAGGAALGALAALALRRALETRLGLSLPVGALALALAGGVGCGVWPAAFPIAAGALPGALLGAAVPLAGRAVLGAGAGALLGGVVGLAVGRVVAIAFASAAGGVLVAVGAAAVLGAGPLGRELVARPFALVALALVLAIAGAAYQLERGDAPRRAGPEPRAPAAREPTERGGE